LSKLCAAIAAVAMLLLAAAAAAQTVTLKGKLKGDSGATVTLKVTLNKTRRTNQGRSGQR
jgi:phage tail sheath gpL-like